MVGYQFGYNNIKLAKVTNIHKNTINISRISQ